LESWVYKDGADYTLSDEEVMKLRGSGN
jgi:branched-chain amino acid transport system substrate-binding protein